MVQLEAMVRSIIAGVEKGETLEPTLLDRVLCFFKLTSIGNLTFKEIRGTLSAIQSTHQAVGELKNEIQGVIDRAAARLNRGSDVGILSM
jgi:hypothetical protein